MAYTGEEIMPNPLSDTVQDRPGFRADKIAQRIAKIADDSIDLREKIRCLVEAHMGLSQEDANKAKQVPPTQGLYGRIEAAMDTFEAVIKEGIYLLGKM